MNINIFKRLLTTLGLNTGNTYTGDNTFSGSNTFSGATTLSGTANFGADGAGIMVATYMFTGTPAATDQVFFVAPRACKVIAVSEVHSVAAGATSKLQLVKDTSTDAPGAGTDMLTNNTNTGFDLNGTANTVQNGTLATTTGLTTLAAGDRLSVDYANSIGSSAGVVVTVILQPL